MRRTRARKLLPVFQSEEEELRFWDTHDPDEYFGGPEVSLESLFTPDGIEWVEATRATRQNRRRRPRT